VPDVRGLKGALDIGAGDGAFLERLQELGCSDIHGIEPSDAPVQAAGETIRKYIKNVMFRPDDFAREAFSLITCFQTVEHMDDPGSICSGSYHLLRKGGIFFVVCHNFRSLSARMLGPKSPIFDIEHLQLFSPKSIAHLLRNAGFHDIRVFSIRNRYPLHYWIKLMPCNTEIKKKLMAFSKKAGFGDIPISLPAGNIAAWGVKD
jgi:2-polyprenyl-3-methyl-5-hydroxy-6-metoxy-1,4-benzoquinol methylase